MQVKVDGKRNITLDFEAPKKFKLLQDGKEIPYLRTGKNSFRLSRNIDGVLDLEEIIEQPKIVKPMQLQTQQMALVNPNDVLMINQAAQQLEVEQNILGETQKRVEQTQAYLDVQQQRINETVLSVQGLETDNAERITATENGLFNLAGSLAKTEQNLVDGISVVNNDLQEHKSAENPHRITKKTIGLDKVDNTSDMDKPISKAVQNALNEKADKDEIQAIRDELGEYQEKNDRFTNALSNYTGGLAYSGSDITIDDMLSTESENPVQNKVITNALNEKADISDIPTVNNATLTIQKNGTSAGTFSANASEDVNINLIIPTTASDVSALPDSTKYGAGLSLTINSTNYVMTAQLKDQDGNNLGTAQTIDLPLESVVVSGSYDSVNKKIVLTLQNGTTIDIPVGDLVSGLQTEITENNKLDADLVDDSTSTNKFVTASDITTWNGKQDTLTAGTNITIENNVISSVAQESFFRGNFNDWSSVPTDTSLYHEDIHGNRIPKNTDFIVIEDASQYIPVGDLMHKLVIECLVLDVRITDETGVSKEYNYTDCPNTFVAIDDYYSLQYSYGSPGNWYIKTNDGSPIIVKGTTYQSGQVRLFTTNEGGTILNVGMPPQAGQYQGAWRFAYYGVWSADGITGWTPQYKIENTLPIANETTFGIAKLYTTTGSNTDGSITQKAITDSLATKQDNLTAGTNITIRNNIISSTAYESFFRGKYTDWEHTPTDPSAYLEDFHGNTTPLKNDYIVVTDASAYVSPDFSDDPENVAFQRNPSSFTINVIVGNNTISVFYAEIANYKSIRELFTSKGYTDIGCEWLKLKYIPGAPGIWNITSTSSYYENNKLVSANTDHFLMNTSEPVTSMFYLSKNAGVAPIALFGGWRFRYLSDWSDKGKNGWKPEYQVEDVLPIATPTEPGIAKLYTTTGQNTDGSVTQKLVTDQLGTKQDTLVSGTNIKTINNQSLLGSGNIDIQVDTITATEVETLWENN